MHNTTAGEKDIKKTTNIHATHITGQEGSIEITEPLNEYKEQEKNISHAANVTSSAKSEANQHWISIITCD
jgi:hypothetical protein